MPTPSDTTTTWIDITMRIGPLIGAAVMYLFGWQNGRGKAAAKLEQFEANLAKVMLVTERHDDILIEHTLLHRQNLALINDVRSTRECVIEIAASLGIKRP